MVAKVTPFLNTYFSSQSLKIIYKNNNKYYISKKQLSKLFNNFIKSLDILLLFLVISYFINDFFYFISYLLPDSLNIKDVILHMADKTTNTITTNTNNNITTTIIHDDGGWANGIRSLFIYGTGVLRFQLVRHGTPTSKFAVIVSTMAADSISKIINNTINDPTYVKSHIANWTTIWKDANEKKELEIDISKDSDTIKALSDVINNKFMGDSTNIFVGFEQYIKKLIQFIINYLQNILQPTTVNYSNEILANQINDISILLFILSLLIIFMVFVLLLNIVILINTDRIYNYFNNKYIRLYISLNKKLMSLEVLVLGSSILYFMCNLSYGIHFIATHPITFS